MASPGVPHPAPSDDPHRQPDESLEGSMEGSPSASERHAEPPAEPRPSAGAGVPGTPGAPAASQEPARAPASAGVPGAPGAQGQSTTVPPTALAAGPEAAPEPSESVPQLSLPTGPRALPPAALKHWRIRAFIRVLILLGIATAAGVALVVGYPASGTPLGLRFALPFVLPLVAFVHALVMPKLRWKRARWSVDATTIVWRHGVIFHVENTVPRSRVQHIEVTQGPLQRKLGLAALVIYTAGERLHAVTIAGMHADEARALRSTLLERVGGHVV